jgi:hypothetical protein
MLTSGRLIKSESFAPDFIGAEFFFSKIGFAASGAMIVFFRREISSSIKAAFSKKAVYRASGINPAA